MCKTSQHSAETNGADRSFPNKLFRLLELRNIMFESQGKEKKEVSKTVFAKQPQKSNGLHCLMLHLTVFRCIAQFDYFLLRTVSQPFLFPHLGTQT